MATSPPSRRATSAPQAEITTVVLGLIASIRRVSVITLQASETMHGRPWSPDIQQQFQASTIELAVLGLLILAMVVAIYILRKTTANADG
jgi:hypothetical protein